MKFRINTIPLAIFACLLWASVYPVIKIGLQFTPPFHFAGIRFILAGLLILPFTVPPKEYMDMISGNKKLVLSVTLLQTILNYSLFYYGLKLVPGAIGAMVVGSQPLITAVVSSLLITHDKMNARKIATISSGIAGVFLISAGRQAFHLSKAIELLGILMIFGANFATAVSNVLISAGNRKLNPFVLSSFSLFTGGIFVFILSLIFEKQPDLRQPAQYWASLIWLTFVAAVAFSLWYKLLQRPGIKVSELNLWKFVIPGIGAILSWLMLPGEHPDWLTITGIIIITITLIAFFGSNKNNNR